MDIHIGGGVLGVIHLIIVIWAMLNIVQSGTSTGSKLLWILLILLLPVVGIIIWLLFGPRELVKT